PRPTQPTRNTNPITVPRHPCRLLAICASLLVEISRPPLAEEARLYRKRGKLTRGQRFYRGCRSSAIWQSAPVFLQRRGRRGRTCLVWVDGISSIGYRSGKVRRFPGMDATRFLVVIADAYGIGAETSRGSLELDARNLITGTVLLVNSPSAEEAVRAWRH